jgi:hypothetical protein
LSWGLRGIAATDVLAPKAARAIEARRWYFIVLVERIEK